MESGVLVLAWIIAVAVSCVYLAAGRGAAGGGALDRFLTWLAVSVVVVLVGGGLAMFAVVLAVFFLPGAAGAGLAAAWAVVITSPFAVAILQRRRCRAARP